MAITAAMVMSLRNKTGLPMMECKKALEEANGDEAKAVELLRKKGLSQMDKRSGRATSEGRIACYVDADNGRVGIAELLCETEPVAKTEDFIKLVNEAARAAARLESPTSEAVLEQPLSDNPGMKIGDLLTDVVNRIRENIRVARVGNVGGHMGHYLHHNAKVGVVVEMSEACPDEVRADVCMHIAALKPTHTRREDVASDVVEQERKFAAEQAQGKPENIIEKIVAGKLSRWFSEFVLLEQPFVKEEKQSVGQMLMAAAPELTVKRFLRYEVGQS